MSIPKPFEEKEQETITKDEIALPFNVFLFNDDWHSFEEVISQLVKALRCSVQKAKSLTFEVHVHGKAVVFSGELLECLKVSSILEEISLHTQIII